MNGKITAKDLTSGIKRAPASEMLEKLETFLKYVESGDEEKKPFSIVPTFSAFADYIGASRADMHEWLRCRPTEGKQMRNMVADTIASGSMQKAYEPRMAAFALKNWCGWEEAPQKKDSKGKEVADEKKAGEMLEEYNASNRRHKFKVV